MNKYFLCLMVVCFMSCKTKKDEPAEIQLETKSETVLKPSNIESSMLAQGLVKMKDIDASIKIEMKYSTTDNFMNADVYGEFDEAFFQKKTASMLKNANASLHKIDSNYVLLIYDAARPRSIQQVLWDTLKVKPGELKTDFVADPKKGSIHNYGCAVDLTVFDKKSDLPLDMGTKYDFFGELAYPKHEAKMLREGRLSQSQLENRNILRRAMKSAGFMPIESEWWHFNSISRERAKAAYKIIE